MSRLHNLPLELDALRDLCEGMAMAIEELTERVNELSKAANLPPLDIQLIEEVDEEADAALAELARLEAEEAEKAKKKAALENLLKAKAEANKKKK